MKGLKENRRGMSTGNAFNAMCLWKNGCNFNFTRHFGWPNFNCVKWSVNYRELLCTRQHVFVILYVSYTKCTLVGVKLSTFCVFSFKICKNALFISAFFWHIWSDCQSIWISAFKAKRFVGFILIKIARKGHERCSNTRQADNN